MSMTDTPQTEGKEVASTAGSMHRELAELELHSHAAVVQMLTALFNHRAQHQNLQQAQVNQAASRILAPQ